MPELKTNVDALQAAGLRKSEKVLVGRAPVTEKYADQMVPTAMHPMPALPSTSSRNYSPDGQLKQTTSSFGAPLPQRALRSDTFPWPFGRCRDSPLVEVEVCSNG